MANQFSSSDSQTLRSVQDLLRTEWEPIGVGVPIGEYNSYAMQAVLRARRHDSAEKIANYLTKVETRTIGLNLVPGVRERNLKVAQRVLEIVDAAGPPPAH